MKKQEDGPSEVTLPSNPKTSSTIKNMILKALGLVIYCPKHPSLWCTPPVPYLFSQASFRMYYDNRGVQVGRYIYRKAAAVTGATLGTTGLVPAYFWQ